MTMKAIRYYEYGSPDVLKLEDVPVPSAVEGRVLVRVKAASLNPYDWHFMRGKPSLIRLLAGLTKPKNNGLGADFAGVVEAVGAAVNDFKPGDEVFGEGHGALAETMLTGTKALAMKPAGMSFEQAAATPMVGLTALQALRNHGNLQSGQRVLINGASGGIGTTAIQVARAMGAEVTGVCSSRNVDLVKSLGADRVIDYTHEDFASLETKFDLMLDTVGNRSIADCRRALTPSGTCVQVGGDGGSGELIWGLIKFPVSNLFAKRQFKSFIASPGRPDLEYFCELFESGRFSPVIDRAFPLERAAEAIAYLETRRARGKVIVLP